MKITKKEIQEIILEEMKNIQLEQILTEENASMISKASSKEQLNEFITEAALISGIVNVVYILVKSYGMHKFWKLVWDPIVRMIWESDGSKMPDWAEAENNMFLDPFGFIKQFSKNIYSWFRGAPDKSQPPEDKLEKLKRLKAELEKKKQSL